MNENRPSRRPRSLQRACSVLLLVFICSGCTNPVKEMESYTPPVLYDVSHTHRKVPEKPKADSEFQAQKQKLDDMRKELEKSQENPKPDEVFYLPDPNRLKLLTPAFTDEQAVQTAIKDSFPIETLEILAYGRSPMVKSAEKNFQASIELYSQVSNLEDMLRQYSAFNAALMPGVGNMENSDSIGKKFPFPGMLALKGKVVGLDIQLSKEDIEIARRTAITEIRKLYWELLYNRKAQAIADDSFDFLKNMEASVTRRYETGKAPIQELTKVRIRKEKIREDLTTIREERNTIERKIKSLLDLSDAVRIGNPNDIEPPSMIPLPEKLTAAAIVKRQELKKMRFMITRMELMIEMAETEIYPGFTQNLSLTDNRDILQSGTMKMQEPFAVNPTESLSPKMPWTGLSQAYLRETKQRLESLRRDLTGAEADTAAKVREAWLGADKAKREWGLYKERIVSLSRLDLSVSSKAYESGMMAFSDMIESFMLLFESRLSTERKKADLGQAIAAIDETVGGNR